jgi:hypothetical protein
VIWWNCLWKFVVGVVQNVWDSMFCNFWGMIKNGLMFMRGRLGFGHGGSRSGCERKVSLSNKFWCVSLSNHLKI